MDEEASQEIMDEEVTQVGQEIMNKEVEVL